MHITFDCEGFGICRIRGEVTGTTATTLNACVPCLIYHPAVLLDLSDVVLIDHPGLAALAGIIDTLQRSATRVTVVLAPALRRVVLAVGGLIPDSWELPSAGQVIARRCW